MGVGVGIFLVSFDLLDGQGREDGYRPLMEEMRRVGAFRCQRFMWLVSAEGAAGQIAGHFKRFVAETDRILTTELRADSVAYINAVGGTTKWLEANPPRA